MKTLQYSLIAACVLAYSVPAAAAGAADTYPSRPVRIVVDFPAGGTIDTLARIVGQQLSDTWNQPVVVENRPGAGGNIGAHEVFTAEADGYTLLATPPGPLSINEYLYKDIAFRPAEFTAVGMLATSPNAITVSTRVPAKSVQELISHAKANPGKLSYGSQGNGSTSHLTGQLFATLSGTSLVHVPYKGEGPALTDLMAGRIDVFFGNISAALRLRETGKLRILAVASSQRSAIAPDVPSSKEAGFPGFDSSAWFALMAPPGTPAPIVQKINDALTAMLKKEDIKQKFLAQGAEAVAATPAETNAFIESERVRWKKVIADAGVTLD
ncbi:MAG: tripartite tricarboxylate transporter substrate binding protein [Pigmentiphaga sp.]|uniref:Bug family tripartite tricarboxylate transporter substrate binding protein n=1 Tax=Pigmentiphaga sp. TaxID=1977564 RepID=UPI0029BD1417|nr:tripartite tricarboxylate transporter substrate binding protein [Pigmentiphaga sp.]MDX3905442.1 tripartite tricarboxylate transporter substrate binding protein [Pigmentiphaga sp.]